MNSEILWLDEVDSTNRFLVEKAKNDDALPNGFVVVAEHQTVGKGQGTNRWESEAEKNLLFSLLLKPDDVHASEQFIISQIVALGLRETVEAFLSCKVSVKWPNDIYVGDKKIAGILIENRLQGARITQSIVGVGLNVNQRAFVSDAPNPVSMCQIADLEFDRQQILTKFLQRVEEYFADLTTEKRQAIANSYLKNLYRSDGFYWFEDDVNGRFSARIADVLPNGHLVLERKNDAQRYVYAFKEVRFCG